MQSVNKPETPKTAAFAGHILAVEINDFLPPSHGPRQSRSRVIPNIIHLLDHIDKHRAEANFFITADLMADFPEIISLVSSRGHEIGLCYDCRLNKDSSEIARHKAELEKITGQQAQGCMLRCRREDGRSLLKSLAGHGFRYGVIDFKMASRVNNMAPVEMNFDKDTAIDAFPPSLYRLFGIDIEFGEPGRIRLYPYWFLRKCMRSFTKRNLPAVMNFPLWEFDPHLPRRALSPMQSLRSYGNLSLVEYKLTRLLLEFDFIRISRILELENPEID